MALSRFSYDDALRQNYRYLTRPVRRFIGVALFFFCFGAVEKNYAANPYLWADRELTGFEEGGDDLCTSA